ncbi:hypothetical protein H6G04_32755 [Calothrix membranacea FACHB-236]|nr:hypothetical protein [Calothrix membranacea FACHB-236]
MDERSLIDNPIALVMKEPMFSMDERSLIDNPITLVVKEPMFSMDELIFLKYLMVVASVRCQYGSDKTNQLIPIQIMFATHQYILEGKAVPIGVNLRR